MPFVTGGFETETELTIKALARRYRIAEIPVDLGSRPQGSFSKIRIVHDGWTMLNTILALSRDYKPLTFFGVLGLICIAAALILEQSSLRISQDRSGTTAFDDPGSGLQLGRSAGDHGGVDNSCHRPSFSGTTVSIAINWTALVGSAFRLREIRQLWSSFHSATSWKT
jgi:hypothetical protein